MAQVLGFGNLVQYLTPFYFATATLSLYVAYWIVGSIYNIYFHPLSKYPGPKIAAATKLWHSKHWVSGKYPQALTALHEKYGTVIRIAPNSLSFSSPSSWKDIYGHTTGRPTFVKTDWYNDGTHPNLATSRDPEQHARMRKMLNNGFSSKALLEQEDIIHGYIDSFVKQLDAHATEKSADMTQWYNFASFDIVGDLSFGEPFGSLKTLELHFWPALIMKAIKALAWISEIAAYPWLKAFIPYIVPKKAMAARVRHWQYAKDKIIKRMNTVTDRKDFMSKILENKESQNITIDEMQAHSSVMVLAGSETTATSLSGITYYLCRNPRVYKKLVTEIRESFQNYDDIKGLPTEKLPYLKAVIEEELRIFPPVPFGTPRYSPGEMVDGYYIPKGVVVSTMSWAATHHEGNFHRPYEFLPERWLDPECKDIKEASQPFLLGSRSCIGRNLALMEMRTILSKMLWVFDMELVDDNLDWSRDTENYLLWNRPELHVKYTRRPGIYVPPIDNKD